MSNPRKRKLNSTENELDDLINLKKTISSNLFQDFNSQKFEFLKNYGFSKKILFDLLKTSVTVTYPDVEILKAILFIHLSDPLMKDKDGKTILHFLSSNPTATPELLQSLVEKIRKNKIDVRIALNEKDNFGNTPLHYACMKGNKNFIDELLKFEIPSNIRNNNAKKPLEVLDAKKLDLKSIGDLTTNLLNHDDIETDFLFNIISEEKSHYLIPSLLKTKHRKTWLAFKTEVGNSIFRGVFFNLNCRTMLLMLALGADPWGLLHSYTKKNLGAYLCLVAFGAKLHDIDEYKKRNVDFNQKVQGEYAEIEALHQSIKKLVKNHPEDYQVILLNMICDALNIKLFSMDNNTFKQINKKTQNGIATMAKTMKRYELEYKFKLGSGIKSQIFSNMAENNFNNKDFIIKNLIQKLFSQLEYKLVEQLPEFPSNVIINKIEELNLTSRLNKSKK